MKNKKMLFLLIMMSAIIGCGNTDKIDEKESVCVHENTENSDIDNNSLSIEEQIADL